MRARFAFEQAPPTLLHVSAHDSPDNPSTHSEQPPLMAEAEGAADGTAGADVGARDGWRLGTIRHAFTFAENTPPLMRRNVLPGHRSGANTLPWKVWAPAGYQLKSSTRYTWSSIVATKLEARGVWPFEHNTFWNFTCAFFTTTLYGAKFSGRLNEYPTEIVAPAATRRSPSMPELPKTIKPPTASEVEPDQKPGDPPAL